jgi:hypothetical protein
MTNALDRGKHYTSSEVMLIHKSGTLVTICGNIKAYVIAVQIEHDVIIAYKVGYWVNQEYKEVWLPDAEITVSSSNKTGIGFLSGN